MITITLELRLLESKIKTGTLSVSKGTTISELLLSNGLKWEQIPHLTVLVDGKYVDLSHQLKDGNFVRVLPLLEGG